MNFVVLIGYAGGDAKTGTTGSGMKWANVNLATSRRKKDGTYESTWHRIVGWDRTAERLGETRKGDKLMIKGEIQKREYEKDGQKRNSVDIIAQEVIRGIKSEAGVQTESANTMAGYTDEDIPF